MNGLRKFWVRAALLVSLLVPIYFLAAALGTRFGLLDWRVGFGALTYQWGPRVLMGAAGFAAIGLLLALVVPPFGRGWRMGLVALLIPAIGLGYGLYVRHSMAGVPPIHDITTDLSDPPEFSERVVAARASVPCGNGLELLTARVAEVADPACALIPPGPPVVELHRAAYADLTPIEMPAPPDQAYELALAVARAQGWTLGMQDKEAGRFEATQRSFWYGFTDDIAVRVRPMHQGSVADVRSVSRVGISDMGANAKRIRAFTAALKTQAAG